MTNKNKTPAEELGYKVGDKFKALVDSHLRIKLGSMVEFLEDDGTRCPWFTLVGKSERYSLWLNELEKIVEPKFKIGDKVVMLQNADFYSEGDVGVVIYQQNLSDDYYIDFGGQGNENVCGGGRWYVQENNMKLIDTDTSSGLVPPDVKQGDLPKYEDHPLYPIYMRAIHQAMFGKGERHGGCSVPFLDQPWKHYAKLHGRGFLTGQSAKKLEEAASTREGEPFTHEVLGSIVFAGMSILHEELKNDSVD